MSIIDPSFFLAVDTYQELLDGLASEEYFLAILNSDVARHRQDEIRKKLLRFVYHVADEAPIQMYFPMNITHVEIHRFTYCFANLTYSVVEKAVSKFRGYIKVCQNIVSCAR